MANDNKDKFKLNKAVIFLSWLFFVPFSIGIFLILTASLCTTIYYDLYQEADLPRFGKENVPLLIVLSVVVFLLLYRYWKRIRKQSGSVSNNDFSKSSTYKKNSTIKLSLIWAGAVCLYLILIVRGLATNDALQLDVIINDFMRGDFSSLTQPGGYLFVYPFQLGYVAIGQLIYILFGESNYLVYQLINVLSILVTIWLLYKITWELFEKETICRLMAVLSTGMFFLFMYADFVYSDIWSIAPEVAAIYFTIRYLKNKKKSDVILAGILNGFAIVLKTNAYIAMIAMVIMIVLDAFRTSVKPEDGKKDGTAKNDLFRRVMTAIIISAMMLIVAKGMQFAVNTGYAKAAGIDEISKGVPSTTYLAMAMHESGGEPGWYDGYNVDTYGECGYDRDLTSETAVKDILNSLSTFKERPLHACRFYLRKFLSQWADSSCISMRNLELTSRHVDGQPKILESLVYGSARTIVSWIMNVFHFICYLGVFVYCISIYKSRKFSFEEAFLILFLLGGMLFHELWEGSSRYIIRYYVCMLPLAAAGFDRLFTQINRKAK